MSLYYSTQSLIILYICKARKKRRKMLCFCSQTIC